MTTYRKKLIEVALPLEDINREAAREKSIRHGHPSTLHLWWARRPLAACRAVLFASLVDDPSECVSELMADEAKRKAAEKVLAAQRKAWEARKVVFDKAVAGGVPASSVPTAGPEPKLEDILVEAEREHLFDIIRDLVKWENSNDERVLNRARYEIARSVAPPGTRPPTESAALLAFLAKHAPPIYDPFCGGGSIPLEAQRLGLEAHASDLNPVPVLITKALTEIPPRFAGKPPVNPESRRKLGASGSWKGAAGLAEDIRYYGKWMRDEAEKHVGHLYPEVAVIQDRDGTFRHATPAEITIQKSAIQHLPVIAWLWARTVASPNPAAKGAHVPLVRSFWLSTKAAKKAWVDPVVDRSTMTYRFEVRTGNGEPRAGTVNRNGGVCLLTGSPMPLEHIRSEGAAGRMGALLMAIVAEAAGRRTYLPPAREQEEAARSAKPKDVSFLEAELSTHPQYMATPRYGMTRPRDLFSNRQLATLTVLCELILEAHARVARDSKDNVFADAVATYLAFALSKTTTRNCTLAIWERGMDRLAGALGRQAIQMQWDYAETNPFAGAGGDFCGTVESLCEVLDKLVPARAGFVCQQDARMLTANARTVYSTDPPYYDNVPYADLSDFFYVWLRRGLGSVYPELLATLLAPKATELVADQLRHGGRDVAQAFFEEGLREVFGRIRANSSPQYPFTVYYAFKQQETDTDTEDDVEEGKTSSTGWETMLEGLVSSGFSVNGTWPMRTEQPKGLREGGRNALASSIVLVCRPRAKDAGVASRRDFLAALKRELPEALRNLQKGNIAPVDLAQAAIGPGMAVFSRYARVLETDGSPMGVRTALSLINHSLDEVLAEQEGEFDVDTRWALAWFDQYGFAEGPYGAAETLCTAKNTSVSGMADAGILAAKAGKVRLLKKEELPATWDPATDERLTIWEATHHLIRTLDKGEQVAAELLRRLGLISETARDLSYRLYTVCERRKWSQDAIGYNALVLAWPDLTRLAQEQRTAGPQQGELI